MSKGGFPKSETALAAFTGLLGEFRKNNIAAKKCERDGINEHLTELSAQWDRRFPGLPRSYFPYSSLIGVSRRGVRDRFLKGIIADLLKGREKGTCGIIINPACVFGRGARDLAARLPAFKVIATDIDPTWNRLYQFVFRWKDKANYEFRKDDIFNPAVQEIPAAVVFFGACGSLSDAAMDYAIISNAQYLVCRTCCHDNIGGNTRIRKRFTLLNLVFRHKTFVFALIRAIKKENYYFSDKYSRRQYPRSEAARKLSSWEEFMEVSCNSVDSDICRTIIDLDRYLYLAEHGYKVWYKAELFVAAKAGEKELS